jgi:ketosteroid isomerase-like protein
MLDKAKLETAAEDWIAAWNNRDFEKLMSHYADDVEFYSAEWFTRR